MAKINAFRIQKGWIEVICGPMFSGKSEELLRRLNLLKFSEVDFLLFVPKLDTRTGANRAKSRDGRIKDAITVSKSIEILDYLDEKSNIQLIAIDEAQFFDEDLPDVCKYLADNDYIVIASGLDSDYTGEPFKVMMRLLGYAEKITKLKAICTKCGAEASFTEKLKVTKEDKISTDGENKILVGDSEIYTARCRHCHSFNNSNQKNLKKIKKAAI